MTPVANFSKNIAGLSVTFTDTSSNLPTSWAWNFGDASTSTDQNPSHVYSTEGYYTVALTATNASGSNTKVVEILVSTTPILNQTIQELVSLEVPTGIDYSSDQVDVFIKKWQLYLQPLVVEKTITDIRVFDQPFWPPLVNMLISKLVIYEIILAASKLALLSYNNTTAAQLGKTTQVCDYTINHAMTPSALLPMTNITLAWDTSTITNVGPVISIAALITWLNSLDVNLFQYTNGIIFTTNSAKLIKTLTVTYNGSTTVYTFVQTNCELSTVTITNTSQNTNAGVKYIETGPSKVEWFNVGDFWDKMFRVYGQDQETGVFGNLVKEICMIASRVRIQLPICDQISINKPLFKITDQ